MQQAYLYRSISDYIYMDITMNKLQLKPRDLKIISLIASTQSISQAAVILGMAQANASKYLADFENKIGLKVFDRTTRSLALTPFGKSLLPHIDATLDNAKQLVNFIADYKQEKHGQVAIHAPVSIISWLSKSVIHLLDDIGDISLKLKTDNLDREAFYEGANLPDDCDILITYAWPKDESLVATRLTQYSVTAFASKDYLDRHPISSPEELEDHSCILIDSMMIDDSNIWKFQQPGSQEIKDYKVSGKYICDNTQTALELARNGLGIVFASEESLQTDIQNGTLIPCFPHQAEWWMDLVAIYRKREYQPWRVQFVLDEILKIIRHQIEQAAQHQPAPPY